MATKEETEDMKESIRHLIGKGKYSFVNIPKRDGKRNDKTMLKTNGNKHEIAIKITILSSMSFIPFLTLNRKSGSESIKEFSVLIF